MKKITKLIAVLSIVASVFMMCGCGLKDAIDTKHNTWCKYEKGVDIPLGDDTSETTAAAKTMAGAELYLYYSDTNGLLVVVQKDTEATVQVLGIPQTMTVTTGAKKQYTKDQFKALEWDGLAISGKISKCDTPKLISNPDGCYDVSEIFTEGVQWKKVLANILVNQLLSD